jgi:hypothetical protein
MPRWRRRPQFRRYRPGTIQRAAGSEQRRFLLQCMGPLMAQSGHGDRAEPRLLLGAKRTSRKPPRLSAYDPNRSFQIISMASPQAA